MVVVEDRSMTNAHVIDNRPPWSIMGIYMHLFHHAQFVNELTHMILTLTGGGRMNFGENNEN